MKQYTITDPAYKVLCRDFKSKQIPVVSFRELLTHDGCDEYGFKSDLWDFYVIVVVNGEHIYNHYHWENWDDDDPHEYEHVYSELVSKLTGYYLEQALEMS